jgi:hypothetical protein
MTYFGTTFRFIPGIPYLEHHSGDTLFNSNKPNAPVELKFCRSEKKGGVSFDLRNLLSQEMQALEK